MPPSRHSSSSHSSSSHSSSSHSSSSRSSSSHSSSSRSYSSGSSRSFSSRGPSSHSGTSRFSRPLVGGGSRSDSRVTPMRPRVNQPTGYKPTGGQAPYYVYGRSHDYTYYPVSWVDEATGRSFEKGYYDENGRRYEDVSLAQNGRYENVLCHCSYCGQDTVLNLGTDEVTKSLQCPNCGAPMEIKSQLDERVQGSYLSSGTGSGNASTAPAKRRVGCLIGVVIALVIAFISCIANEVSDVQYTAIPVPVTETGEAAEDVLYLRRVGDGAYEICDNAGSADKILTWDYDADSFYDEESESWLWLNTDVTPEIWQYWFEGISSDYGDYGWMEHDEEGWFIEASEGNWIPLPSSYDTDGLWYLTD